MKISSKKFVIVLAIIDVALIATYSFLYIELGRRNEDIGNANQDVMQFTSNAQGLASTVKALQTAKDEIQKIDTFYVAADGAVDFLKTLETLARDNGLSTNVQSVDSTDISRETKNFQEMLRIHLQTIGSWDKTYQFISFLKNLPYKLTLEQTNLSTIPSNASSTKSTWQSNFTIAVYKLK